MTARIDKVSDKRIIKKKKQVHAAKRFSDDIAADATKLEKLLTQMQVKIIAEKEKNPDEFMTASIEDYIKPLDVVKAIKAPFIKNVEREMRKLKQLKEERIEFKKKKIAEVDNLQSSLIEAMNVDHD